MSLQFNEEKNDHGAKILSFADAYQKRELSKKLMEILTLEPNKDSANKLISELSFHNKLFCFDESPLIAKDDRGLPLFSDKESTIMSLIMFRFFQKHDVFEYLNEKTFGAAFDVA